MTTKKKLEPGEPGYWEGRKKLGKPKIFPTPESLWEKACDYFDRIDSNPFQKAEGIKSGDLAGAIMKIPTLRPYSWAGLENYLFEEGIINALDHYRYNLDGRYENYIGIIAKIDRIIYDRKIEGASVGVFNPSIISRELGLTDNQKVDHGSSDGSMSTKPKLTPDDIKEIKKALDEGI